eukprot:6585385-Pyramimonas_sp.AAC.1
MSGGGLVTLEAWLVECKKSHPKLLSMILKALLRFPMTLKALQADNCNIGKVTPSRPPTDPL